MMMRRRFARTIVAFALFCLATPLYAATPWLHTDGNVIKDPCGNTVVLRGIDLIDLGFLQDWEGGAIAMVDRLTNQSDPCGSSPGWYPRVLRINITPPDSVSGWPHPFNPNNTDLYNLLRSVVDYCKTKGLYAIIDWHYVDNTYSHVATTNTFWTYMAPKFANDSHVIFELFNEPINTSFGSDNANWLSVRTDMQNWFNIVRSYAPNNLILVAGPSWSQAIGPAATYPLTGDNIAIVSHIYPYHWLVSPAGNNWYTTHINNCLTRYPVFMSEWGFYNDPNDYLGYGSITNYGQPLQDFREARKISNSAWVSSYDWTPTMYTGGLSYKLRIGEYEMGGFVKDTLYLKRSDNQPSDGNTIPPAAPTGLTATPSTGTITLDWNDNNEGDLYGYDIYRSTTPGGQTSRLNLVRSKTSAYTDTNVAGTRTYYYVVTAVDTNFNSSADSLEVSATVPADSTPPAAPSGVSATAGDGTVSLDWNNNTEPDINGYNVYRSTISGGPYTRQNGVPLSSSDFNDANVTNGTIYYYIVTAVDTSLNESANSSQVSARPQLNPIVGIIGSWITGTTHAKESGYNRALVFVAHTKGTTSSTPSLTAVTYGGRSMTKIIDRSTGSSTSRVYVAAFILNDANISAATSTTFTPTWTNQPPSITYSSVFLQNVNQTTLVGATASAGATSSTTVSTSALANSNGDMVLESAASSVAGTYTVTSGWTIDIDLSVTGYDGMGGHKPATGASETPSITQSSGNHSLIGFVVKMAPNVAPAAPTGLSATSGIGIVLLNWNNNTEPDLAGYNVYRSTTSGSGYVKLNSSLLTSSDYTDTNVVNGITYYYVVTAVDTAGLESVNSGEVSATPSTPAIGTGAILRQWWLDIPGSSVDDLLNNPNYPYNPNGRQLITKLEGPVNWADDYGTLLRGYLNPVTSANYTFWISSNASSELYLSTDTDPYNIQLIGYVSDFTDYHEWYKYPEQQSSPISLVAGQKYFIMAVHKASTDNDNIAVAWQGPGISQQVIDGIYLSPCCLQFADFAELAAQWNRTDCDISNDWCSGGDFNRDGTVGIDDLASFAEGWLTSGLDY
ncbi:MAG: cellulase family glycosylhydrolase [Sedimentisphaerales bacterium]|jgi:fibronectin type 3 domain-containing protein